MLDKVQVGIVTTTHGLKGEVKVYPTSDDPERFESLDHVMLEYGRQMIDLEIEDVRYFKGRPILKFVGYDRIEDVQKWHNCPLYVDRSEALPLGEDEYFVGDLIGCDVFLEDDSKLGVIKDVLITGANDVYVVKKDAGGEVLIPVIDDCVLIINPEENRIVVHLLPEI